MARLSALLAASATLAAARPSSFTGHLPATNGLTSGNPKANYSLATNYVTLSSVNSTGKHSALYALTSALNRTTAGTTDLLSLFEGEEFAVEIGVGGGSYQVIVDTGSSDTWLVADGFECVDVATAAQEPESTCNFGATFPVSSSGLTKLADENFSISYGDGEFLTGYMGTIDITVADITVKNQTMGVVDYAGWNGDGATAGLMGLAFSGLTSAYQGTDASQDGKKGHKQLPYSPIFTSMASQNLSSNLFSLAISRDLSGPSGYLAFGGLPPVAYEGDWVTTPILETEESGYNVGWDFYTITIDGVTLGENDAVIDKTGGDSVFYIVDSGTTLNYLPTDAATAINAAFSPAATYNSTVGGYVTSCNATAPIVGTKISGSVLPIDPLDLLLPLGYSQDGEEQCLSGIVDGGPLSADELYILGDVFLKSLVAVFDIGEKQLAFAARGSYESDDPYRV